MKMYFGNALIKVEVKVSVGGTVGIDGNVCSPSSILGIKDNIYDCYLSLDQEDALSRVKSFWEQPNALIAHICGLADSFKSKDLGVLEVGEILKAHGPKAHNANKDCPVNPSQLYTVRNYRFLEQDEVDKDKAKEDIPADLSYALYIRDQVNTIHQWYVDNMRYVENHYQDRLDEVLRPQMPRHDSKRPDMPDSESSPFDSAPFPGCRGLYTTKEQMDELHMLLIAMGEDSPETTEFFIQHIPPTELRNCVQEWSKYRKISKIRPSFRDIARMYYEAKFTVDCNKS